MAVQILQFISVNLTNSAVILFCKPKYKLFLVFFQSSYCNAGKKTKQRPNLTQKVQDFKINSSDVEF